jgi:hypothetical protein
LLSSTGLFLFCVGLKAMSRSRPNLQARIRFNPARGADKGGDFTTNLATALLHCLLPVAHPRPRCSTKTSRRRPFGSATAPSSFVPNTQKQKTGSTQLGVPTRGAISQETSPLPSVTLTYPSPTQNPVAPPKRVVVERTAALRLRLRPCLAPASKNQVRPSSGCQTGCDLTSNLATAF